MRWLSDRTVEHLKRVAEWPDLAETKYRLLEELGRGGMGTVFLAEDRVLGRKVALKVVGTGASDPAAAARMLREARVIARLEHPGIVPVHDAGTLPDGRMFYAMKRVDGRRLDEIAAGSPLPERLRTFQKVCEAVAFAHAHGVLHRDLKPENVMVGPFGEVLVMDWGVARMIEVASEAAPPAPSASTPEATADGTLVGTPAYMSPEQAAGRTDVGTTADVYALGGLLYFLLTGRPPFEADVARRRARGEANLEPPPARHADASVPAALDAICARAMASRPEARYASAEEVSADVARYLDGSRVLAYREGLREKAARVFARYRTPILLIAAYLLMRSLLLLYGRGR
jgi:eukaryotic-like serine/threonine-protein kinase